MTRKEALDLVKTERNNQDSMWGEETHNIFEWLSILGEEYGELCQAANECYLPNQRFPELGTKEIVVREASHVAAIAVAIIEKWG